MSNVVDFAEYARKRALAKRAMAIAHLIRSTPIHMMHVETLRQIFTEAFPEEACIFDSLIHLLVCSSKVRLIHQNTVIEAITPPNQRN